MTGIDSAAAAPAAAAATAAAAVAAATAAAVVAAATAAAAVAAAAAATSAAAGEGTAAVAAPGSCSGWAAEGCAPSGPAKEGEAGGAVALTADTRAPGPGVTWRWCQWRWRRGCSLRLLVACGSHGGLGRRHSHGGRDAGGRRGCDSDEREGSRWRGSSEGGSGGGCLGRGWRDSEEGKRGGDARGCHSNNRGSSSKCGCAGYALEKGASSEPVMAGRTPLAAGRGVRPRVAVPLVGHPCAGVG